MIGDDTSSWIGKPISRICVYCGAAQYADEVFQKTAEDLGQLLAQEGFEVVYGGGRLGLMGIVASSALAHGGKVIGFIPEFLIQREGEHPTLTELHIVDSMHTRKQRMFDYADAFIVLPGGFGTLDEFFEMMTWRQLDLHEHPIVLINIQGYWDHLLQLIDSLIERRFARPEHRSFMHVVNSPQEAIDFLSQFGNIPFSSESMRLEI